MRLNRTHLFACFTVALTLAFQLTIAKAQPDTLKQIAPGVWFREGNFAEGHSNNAIIEMRDYLVVIDANFPSGAKRVLEDAKRLSAKPIKFVFDTHHHGDHIYGNPLFTRLGAITIAHEGVLDEMRRSEPKGWQAMMKRRPDVAELGLTQPEPPRQTFGDKPYILKDATRTIEFRFFGWAHTRGDGFAWLPKEKVLCTGDVVVNGPYNYTGDGNIMNWPNVIRAARKLHPRHVLPGHGGVGGEDLLAGQLQFFVELQNAVIAAVKQGKKLEEIVTIDNGRATATTITLPESVKNWAGNFLPLQVHDTWREITQHKPAGAIKNGE
jgi:cyclase